MRRTLLAAAALAVITAGCLPPASPVVRNGQLPDSMLTTITPECRIVHELAGGLTQLLADAKTAGVALAPDKTDAPFDVWFHNDGTIPRNEACYRTIEMQHWWRDFHCFYGKCFLAAVPGTSRHGWGRAVDFEGLDGKELTFSDPGYLWLVANAAKYGFHHPAWARPGMPGAEPWHWEG